MAEQWWASHLILDWEQRHVQVSQPHNILSSYALKQNFPRGCVFCRVTEALPVCVSQAGIQANCQTSVLSTFCTDPGSCLLVAFGASELQLRGLTELVLQLETVLPTDQARSVRGLARRTP